MPIKVIIAIFRVARWIPIWFMLMIALMIHANMIVLFEIYDPIQLINLFCFLVAIATVLWFVSYYMELELDEIKSGVKLDYPDEE